MSAANRDVTQLLLDWRNGDSQALDELIPLVYGELRRQAQRYMRKERPDHTLEPTALVHETFLKLIDQTRVEWRNRAHFLAVASQLMRRVTVKHAARRHAAKRGGGRLKLPLDELRLSGPMRELEVLALEEALERLEAIDPRQVRVVELRFFGGLTVEETAEALEVSISTVHREWRLAKAWLRRELGTAPR